MHVLHIVVKNSFEDYKLRAKTVKFTSHEIFYISKDSTYIAIRVYSEC